MSKVDEAKWRSLRRIQSGNRNEITQVTKAGYLWKRGRTLKRWLCRWYVVKNGKMSYAYTPQDAAQHNSENVLSAVVSVRPLGSQPLKRYTPEGECLLMYGMEVEGRGQESVVLYASTEEQRQEWVSLFEKASGAGKFVTDLYDVDINNPLGCGAFATVVKGVDKVDNSKYAVKVISRSAFQECADMLHKEINILHMIGHHPNIVSLKEVLHAPLRVYMVFDFCDGGELVDRVTTARPYGEGPASRIIRQLCQALVHLHDQGVAHMDLKPENIVFQTRDANSPIKLIDFSLATFFHVPTEPGGTPEFVAPEIVRDPSAIAEEGVSGEADMWSVGILLYFLLSGRTPFDDKSVQKILENVMIARWGWRGKHWPHVSEPAKNLIRLLLQPNPARRLTARQVLEHPWVNGSLDLPEHAVLAPNPAVPQPARAVIKPATAKPKADAKPTGHKVVCFASPEKGTPVKKVLNPITAVRLQEGLDSAPSTPHGQHASFVSAREAITPDRDLVQSRTETLPGGSPARNHTPSRCHADYRLSQHALGVLNSITSTRQNPSFSPRHSPKVGELKPSGCLTHSLSDVLQALHGDSADRVCGASCFSAFTRTATWDDDADDSSEKTRESGGN